MSISFLLFFFVLIFCLARFNNLIKEFICNSLLNLIEVFHWKLFILFASKISFSLKSKVLKPFSDKGIIRSSLNSFKESNGYKYSSEVEYIFFEILILLLFFMAPKFLESNLTLNSGNLYIHSPG